MDRPGRCCGGAASPAVSPASSDFAPIDSSAIVLVGNAGIDLSPAWPCIGSREREVRRRRRSCGRYVATEAILVRRFVSIRYRRRSRRARDAGRACVAQLQGCCRWQCMRATTMRSILPAKRCSSRSSARYRRSSARLCNQGGMNKRAERLSEDTPGLERKVRAMRADELGAYVGDYALSIRRYVRTSFVERGGPARAVDGHGADLRSKIVRRTVSATRTTRLRSRFARDAKGKIDTYRDERRGVIEAARARRLVAAGVDDRSSSDSRAHGIFDDRTQRQRQQDRRAAQLARRR